MFRFLQMNPQPDVPPEPVVDPPIKLFNFNEEAMQILTAVPPVRQQFGLISRRILDGVLVMNQMDMLIPAKARTYNKNFLGQFF